MIALSFIMQGDDIFELTDGKTLMRLYFSMQEEDFLKHTSGKCHLWLL